MKVTIYGTMVCPDCEEIIHYLSNQTQIAYEFKDFNVSTAHLKEFLKIRDTHPMFTKIKEEGCIGIPLFQLEDGTLTFQFEEVTARM